MSQIQMIIILAAWPLIYPSQAFAFEESDPVTGQQRTIQRTLPAEPIDPEASSPEYFSEEESNGSVIKVFRRKDPIRYDQIRSYLNLGVSSQNNFAPKLTVAYPLYRYVHLRGSLFYWNRQNESLSASGYGPEFDGILVYENRTVFSPYTGLGFGFESWTQQTEFKEERDQDLFATYFIGLDIRMSKNFGLQLSRRAKQFAGSGPLAYNGKHREKEQIYTDISFRAFF